MVEGVEIMVGVADGVGIVVEVIEGVGILVVVGVGIIFVGSELIINLSSSMKSFGLKGEIRIVLFSCVNVKSSKQNGEVL